jgi:peroxiredoxin
VISKGDAAPVFEGELSDGTTLRSEDFRGRRHLVLYFFAKDFTPG